MSVAFRIAVALTCACGAETTGSSPVANRGRDTNLPLRPACPLLALDALRDRDLWLNAVFPQCPPEPFEYSFWVCGTDCPRPCRIRVNDLDPETVHFDARGRWVETAGVRSRGCAYDHDRLGPCWRRTSGHPDETSLSWQGSHIATADSNAEHVAFVYESDAVARVELSWVSRGAGFANTTLREIGPVEARISLAYDGRGRLIREDLARGIDLEWVVTTTYGYDDAGRVATRRNNGEETTFAYTKEGRLARVDTTDLTSFDRSNHNIRRSIELVYDASDRLIADVDHWGDSVWRRTYDYDCR